MIIGNLEITASRFPWHKGYNWRGMENARAPLNPSGARFGGGWNYKFGVDIGGTTVLLNVGIGIITLSKAQRCTMCNRAIPENSKDKVGVLHPKYPAHKRCAMYEISTRVSTRVRNAIEVCQFGKETLYIVFSTQECAQIAQNAFRKGEMRWYEFTTCTIGQIPEGDLL